MDPLRIGIVGPGKVADRFLAPALAEIPDASLWSVHSRDLGRAKAFGAKHGASASQPGYDDLAKMVADPHLDAVIIANPDRLHTAAALTAIRAGKHVFIEKPLCTDAADGAQLRAALQEKPVQLGVAYHLRHHAGHRLLREKVLAGALGAVRHARIAWFFEAPDGTNWRAAPEVGRWWALGGVGTHALDLLRWLLGPAAGDVVEVQSLIASPVWKSPHDETALLALRFASGVTAELACSVLFSGPTRIELFGTRAYAGAAGTLGPKGEGRIWIDDHPLEFTPVNPYLGELVDFIRAIREQRAPEVGLEEGLRNVEILTQAVAKHV